MGKLTPRKEQFLAAYLIEPNATKAAIKAGYSTKTARSQGQRLLTNVDIQARIRAQTQKIVEKAEVTKERILRALLSIAELDPLELYQHDGTMKALKDMPENARKAIASIETDDMLASVKKVRFHPKVEALALLAKTIQGLIVSSHELTGRNGTPLVPPSLGTPIDFSTFTKADIFRIAGLDMNGNGHTD